MRFLRPLFTLASIVLLSACGAARSPRLVVSVLLEASDLCRNRDADASAATARAAAGSEALGIARELLRAVENRAMRAELERLIAAQEERCSALGAGLEIGPGGLEDGVELAARYGLTRKRRERRLAPWLPRLNRASERAIERLAADDADSAALPTAAPDPSARPPRRQSTTPTPGARSAGPGRRTKGADSGRRAVLEIRRSSAEHRRRTARWREVFRRDGGALRSARLDLQREIEAGSLAQAGSACRAFGKVVERASPELPGSPSRELSIRIRRMLGHYRAGASECAAGRPIAAFSRLSEGDREWASVASQATGLLRPRRPTAGRGRAAARPGPARATPAH